MMEPIRARKTYGCDRCFQPINRGDIYYKYKKKEPSGLYSKYYTRICAKCIDRSINRVDRIAKDLGMFDEFYESLGWD